MRAWRNLSFRIKMVLVFSATIIITLIIATTVHTVQFFNYSYHNMMGHMQLLTEQTLLNYEIEIGAIAQRLISQLINRQIPTHMYKLLHFEQGTERYYRQVRALTDALNQMINIHSGYDNVYLRLTNGQSYSNAHFGSHFAVVADELLSQRYGEKAYGAASWIRTEDGEIYLLRDAYNQFPFQYVGKVVVRIRSADLSSLTDYSDDFESAVVLLDEEGKAVAITGAAVEGMLEGAEMAYAQSASSWRFNQNYSVIYVKGENWTAVGLMPQSMPKNMLRNAIYTSLIIALICAVFGTLLVALVTRPMTRRIQQLVHYMDKVSVGNLDMVVPVESHDEIGQLSVHFNTMVGKISELMVRVVEEANQKNRAEYEMLKYKYHSLQSQINPHFIYNALEVVNALGKLSGQQQICEVVSNISTFFRYNMRNMQKHFITVQEEFESLKQYASIYCHIYGDILSTPFTIESNVQQALIPTMILQPILENALTHGIRAEKAVVSLKAFMEESGQLCLQVRDNGQGIAPEVIERISGEKNEVYAENTHTKSSVGMRNVYDRLKLIYGEHMIFDVKSRLNEGTLVSIIVPLIFDEKELNL